MNKTSYDPSISFRKFGRNAIFNVGGFAIMMLCYMVITPFALGILGKVKFGIWALVMAVTSFARFSNLGLDQALVKFIAEFWAEHKIDDINKTVSTALVCYALTAGAVVCVLLFLRRFLITELLHIPDQLQEEALFILTGVIIIFFFNMVFSAFQSVLLGIQRMDITNGILIVSRVLSAVGVFFFLSKGFGLRGLVINSAIIAFLIICANVFSVKKTIKDFSISIFLFSISHLKRIFKYGVSIFSASVANMSYGPVNKIALTNFVSLSHVTFYDVGTRIQGMIRGLFDIALSPLLPASSELDGHKSTQDIERLYLITSRFILLIAFPVFMLLILLAIPFVEVWLGEGYELVGRAIQFLLVGHFVSLFATPAYITLLGIGKPHLNAIIAISTAGLNLVISVLLAMTIGYDGVLIGISSSLVFASILTIFLFHKTTKFSFNKFLKNTPVRAIATVAGLVMLFSYFSSYIDPWGWTKLIITCTVFLLVYGTAVLAFGFFNNEDKQMFLLAVEGLGFFSKE